MLVTDTWETMDHVDIAPKFDKQLEVVLLGRKTQMQVVELELKNAPMVKGYYDRLKKWQDIREQ